jgi:biotin-(acetyl-CoA carboxylase) ligase
MGQSRMDNLEILTTLATQYTGQINVRENHWDNQEWTIQRYWQRWAHNTQDKYMLEKTDGTIKNGQSRDIDNVGHTIHRTNKC